jgi:hypothetical protein
MNEVLDIAHYSLAMFKKERMSTYQSGTYSYFHITIAVVMRMMMFT